ncbi:hypothetical protein [Pasteurella testudinis]|nr:hypothetical protein [Pasteurella testudinis]
MNLPAAAANDGNLGNENVSNNDILIPRLNLLQALSHEVQPGDEKYIDGARAGMLCNTLNSEVFDAVYCANLNFKSSYVVWRKRNLGGGFYGEFSTEQEAMAALQADPNTKPEDYDVSETHTHVLLLLDETGQPTTPILCDMQSTKLRVSKQWNSMPQLRQGPRFASIWTLSSKAAKNKLGQPYFNYHIEFAGVPSDELYEQIKAKYFELGFDKK